MRAYLKLSLILIVFLQVFEVSEGSRRNRRTGESEAAANATCSCASSANSANSTGHETARRANSNINNNHSLVLGSAASSCTCVVPASGFAVFVSIVQVSGDIFFLWLQ